MAGSALAAASMVVLFGAIDAWAEPPAPAEAAARVDATGDRPWLGVAMDHDDGVAPGVRVSHVIRRSPAAHAGLREGDRLVRIGGVGVSRGADVVQAVASSAVGDTVDVAFVRGGKEQTTRVTLAPYPAADDMLRMDLVGAPAPAWRDVQPVAGAAPTTLEGLRGHVVLLDFWATWCAACRFVAPKLGALQSRYGAQGLTVVGITTEDAQDVAAFARRAAMRYPVVVDRDAETTRSYGVANLPTLVLVDKRGVVRDVAVGYDPAEDARLDAAVRALLAEPTGG